MPPVLLTAQPRSIYFRFFKTCNIHVDCICTYQFQSLVFTVCLMYKFLLVLKLTIVSWFLFAFFSMYVSLISCITLDVSHQHFFPSWAEIIDDPGSLLYFLQPLDTRPAVPLPSRPPSPIVLASPLSPSLSFLLGLLLVLLEHVLQVHSTQKVTFLKYKTAFHLPSCLIKIWWLYNIQSWK